MKKVLIYEGMNYHGECLSSYCSYFNALGYEVTFIICGSNTKDSPLWMLNEIPTYTLVNTISTNPIQLQKHIQELNTKVPNLFDFDLYFIGTITKDSYEFIKYLYKNGIKRSQILHQNHRDYKTFLKFTKNDISLGYNGFVLGIDPQHKFEQFSPIKNETSLEHSKITSTFKNLNIFIGGLSRIHFENFKKLVKAAEQLNENGYNINIEVTGIRQQGDYVLPESKHVHYLGRLSFKELSEKYCSSDFLFVLFDVNPINIKTKADQETFLKGRVSGSRNMSIIYKIPLVVQKPFQLSWGLNDSNSICFEGNDYEQVLKELYNIKIEKYNNIIDSLKAKEQEEFDFCLNNLKNKIKSLETNVYFNNPIINPRNIKKKKFINF